jgi:hypothetical protein
MNTVVPPVVAPKPPVVEPFPSQATGITQNKLVRLDVPKTQPRPAVSRNVPPHLLREPAASDDDLASLLDQAVVADVPGASTDVGAEAGSASTEDAVEAILKRFKGSPEEIARQIAKSYGESERTMRQLQNEKAALLAGKPLPPQNAGMPTPTVTAPVAQPAPVVPAGQQVTVNPFDYKKAGSQFLDDIEGTLKSFDEHQKGHVVASINQVVQNLMVPVYDEVLQMRFAAQFPEVVNEDSWPIIKVLASQSEGATDREKLVNGVKKYQKQIVLPAHSGEVTGDMADMRASVQQPSATAASAGTDKKIYKLSVIRKIMNRGDYGNDPKIVKQLEAAFAEGRVDKNS